MGILREAKCTRCRQPRAACCCTSDPARALRRAMRESRKKK